MGKHRDWTEIRNDYENTPISYASLARKHDIPIDTLKKAAARQGWLKASGLKPVEKALAAVEKPPEVPAKEKEPKKKGTKSEMAPRNGTTVEMAPRIIVLDEERPEVRFKRLVAGMMDRVEAAICIVPPENVQAIKLLTGALKDLGNLQRLDKDELDREEQRARIAKLKSEVRIVDSTDEGGVIFMPTMADRPQPPEDED